MEGVEEVSEYQSVNISAGTCEDEDEQDMMPFEKCPVCGGELVEKQVEKLLRGGMHTAVLKVRAEVCLQPWQSLLEPPGYTRRAGVPAVNDSRR